jgi:hypothetical protein
MLCRQDVDVAAVVGLPTYINKTLAIYITITEWKIDRASLIAVVGWVKEGRKS